MTSENDKKKNRLYEKPKLRTIELAAEEVLAAGCKMSGATPDEGQPVNCGITNNCSQDGS